MSRSSSNRQKKIATPDNSRLRKALSSKYPITHPKSLLKHLEQDTEIWKGGLRELTPEDPVFKALTLDEFNLGLLSNMGLPEQMKSFSIGFSLQLQEEYACTTPSQKATAHLIAHSYCRVLEIQRRMNNYLEKGSISDLGAKYLSILSKELDRAERHYLTNLHTLQGIGDLKINFTVNAEQANIGQQVLAQQRNEYGNK